MLLWSIFIFHLCLIKVFLIDTFFISGLLKWRRFGKVAVCDRYTCLQKPLYFCHFYTGFRGILDISRKLKPISSQNHDRSPLFPIFPCVWRVWNSPKSRDFVILISDGTVHLHSEHTQADIECPEVVCLTSKADFHVKTWFILITSRIHKKKWFSRLEAGVFLFHSFWFRGVRGVSFQSLSIDMLACVFPV